MNNAIHHITDLLFQIQDRVLVEGGISSRAKLVFCGLMCRESFRTGWIVSDSRWPPEDIASLHELAEVGYIILHQEPSGIGASLVIEGV